MKRIFLLIALAVGLSVASVAQDANDFSAIMTKINGACPIATGPGLTFTSIEETPDAIVLDYEINEQTMEVSTMQEQADMLHDVYVSELLSSTDPYKRALRAHSLATGKPVKYHFAGTITDDAFTITVTAAELK